MEGKKGARRDKDDVKLCPKHWKNVSVPQWVFFLGKSVLCLKKTKKKTFGTPELPVGKHEV